YDGRPEVRAGVRRLRGWYPQGGTFVEMLHDERGWLWSAGLNSWLIPDGAFLRLYDLNLEVRLTGEEAERALKEREHALREVERTQLEQERTQKEQERAQKERAWAKLREVGIDPASLE
ncbi:MAG: hypothetical protein M3Y56_15240, partial [Armatimonadota bacterium]|nr:hypothetical protein [Armatimonadota bacterium]